MAYTTDGLYIEDEHLEAFGENVARSLKPSGSISGQAAAHDLSRCLSELGRIHEALLRRTPEGSVTGAGEWLLDNWYLARREGQGAVADLRCAGRLRAVSRGKNAGEEAMLTALAAALVRSGRGEVTASRCEIFLGGFQKNQVLSRRELNLFPAAVRGALLEQILAWAREMDKPSAAARAAEGMGRAFSSLRLLSTLDLSELLERVDRTEQILRRDPAGIYAGMDERTRESYRRQVARLAEKYGCQEHRIAMRVLRMAEEGRGRERHVGWYLFEAPMGRKKRRPTGGLYIGANVLLTLFFSLLMGFATGSAACALLLLFPVSELVKNLLDFILLRILPPTHVPRMELAEGIPAQGRTLCVVSALLTDGESGKKLARRLEEYRLANRDAGENLLFGILADLPESDAPELPEAENWIRSAAEEIETLNRAYGGGFYLLCRPRVKSKTENRYRGWERKRGAILELARLLHGEKSGLYAAAGDMPGLRGVKYILALDGDTRLCPGTARELVGAMLHPLNQPEVDEKRRIVVGGHGILSPRMAVELSSAGRSGFARIFAGQGGTDPYGCASGEVYMDMLGRGGFAGKGILDVEVFLTCMEGRIPEERVLSHDILEGAYLRSGYVGDTELTDGFPSRPAAYFRRMERWVRGDWQNLPWLLRRGRDLPDVERWRIFDNIRRSLAAPMTFVSVLAGFLIHSGALEWAAAAALVAFASDLLLRLADAALRREPDGRVRYHSTVIHGVSGALLHTAVRLLLLPAEAVVCLGAALTALWRMIVSRRRLLQWQTAAQAETAAGDSVAALYRELWPCAAAGVLCAAFSLPIIGRAVGVIWLLAPLLARSLGRNETGSRRPGPEETAYLRTCAGEMWRFYAEFCTPAEHFLPPDNYQDAPPVGVAHRTSPTNIGLCLLSALAADDLGLAPRGDCLGLISHILDTLEGLPKWHGHLYNWYDTRTLEILRPGYVSTVDSGNLAGCLTALRRGLLEKGREDLAERARALYAAMDFAPLYDPSRRLFRIGWDSETEKLTEGWYDLLCSEARLAGYVAIAKGDVPRNHWRRLSRAQVQKDGYRGMASWTGTMFEYLMPELLMPCWRDSLIYESERFCVYCQKKRTAALGLPWGASESAYAALDGMLSYRYKAHGVAALALRRGMDAELVISPYSSFLALTVESAAAVRNLKKLEVLGARGPWGFWEAVDFTPSRLGQGERFRVVHCVMAHHVGMSLLAVANRLENGIMCRRFLAEPAMAAYADLLQEKVPIGGPLLRRRGREIPMQPRRAGVGAWENQGHGADFHHSACCVLSNGFYNVMLTETGVAAASCRELMPYWSAPGRPGGGKGLAFFLADKQGEQSLLPEPDAPEDRAFSWKFDTEKGEIHVHAGGLAATVETAVAASLPGERRCIILHSETPRRGRLLVRLEAVLARYEDYVNHPAYFGLGLHAHMEEGVLLVRRLARDKLEECWLALACSGAMEVRALLDRRGGAEVDATGRWLTGGRLEGAVDVELTAPGSVRVNFALAVAKTARGARDAALGILRLPPEGRASLPGGCASLLGLGEDGLTEAFRLLSRLVFPQWPADAPAIGRELLWRHGISGDLPLVCFRLTGEEDLEQASRLLRQHALLSLCGRKFDLVFLSPDGGDYRRPVRSALTGVLRSMEREGAVGIRGGVHFLPDTPETERILESAQVRVLPGGDGAEVPRETERGSAFPAGGAFPAGHLPWHFTETGAFAFDASQSLPPRAWAQMLTNGDFGCIATERGTGHMWYRNAREAQIIPWTGDALATEGAEQLWLRTPSGTHDLFAAPGDGTSRVEYDLGSAVWVRELPGIQVRTTAFVPFGRQSRILLVEIRGAGEGDALAWRLDPLLSGDRADQCALRCRASDGLLLAENPRFLYPGQTLGAAASAPWLGHSCDRAAWQKGDWSGSGGAGENACLGLLLPAAGETVIVCGFDAPEVLRSLAVPGEARRLLEETRRLWREKCASFTVSTPDPALDAYLNGWAAYQAMAGRVLGRTSLYQSGGAFGYRDQLQDAVNLLPLDRELTRRQILAACAHQFQEGDVQHWWHETPQGPRGVRTRCSDDLLWLPWAVCEYVDATGDRAILTEAVSFLLSPVLAAEEHSRYEIPRQGETPATVLEHGLRSLETVIARGRGAHGLALMLSGDWNDGMDQVGVQGRGESVWLSWFFAHTAARFADLAAGAGTETERTGRIRAAGTAMGSAANAAWAGDWYLRGWFDDGTPLGGSSRPDSVAQSFSVLCPEAEPTRRRRALESAVSWLFDRKLGVVRLFDPPFLDESPDPGYIMSYGPGFRENGGQYTHGAIWLAMACLREDRTEEGWELLRALLPGGRDTETYGAEPYVLAADVYTAPGHEGRAGWSWYTGSAGWYLRVAMSELLGLKLREGHLCLEPRLPADWEGFSVTFRGPDGQSHRAEVRREGVWLDGAPYTDPRRDPAR